MSAIPYMPLWVSDYLAETSDLTAEEHGAYLLLLMAYWQRGGPLPDDPERLAVIARVPTGRWQSVDYVRRFFLVDKGEWVHLRAERELEKIRKRDIADGLRMPPVEWAALRIEIFARDDYTCRYCGEKGGRLECDHVIPVSRGGNHSDDNLVTACMQCNRAKRDKIVSIDEWTRIRRAKA